MGEYVPKVKIIRIVGDDFVCVVVIEGRKVVDAAPMTKLNPGDDFRVYYINNKRDFKFENVGFSNMYTPNDKLEFMMSKNYSLKKLVSRFSLDPE